MSLQGKKWLEFKDMSHDVRIVGVSGVKGLAVTLLWPVMWS